MFSFSSKTQVNRELKLRDVLHQIKADRDVRAEALNINSITLTNIINANTINCEPDEKYKEIYLFLIEVKEPFVPQLFITLLDKTIRFHTFFFIKCGEEIATAMAFKTIAIKISCGKYELKDFKVDSMVEIPSFNNVPEAYKFLMSYQHGIARRREETPDEFMDRINAIHKLQFQIDRTRQAILHEAQPKKKYKYNSNLNTYKKELEKLLKGDE